MPRFLLCKLNLKLISINLGPLNFLLIKENDVQIGVPSDQTIFLEN
jgi:hypothetical protein